MLTLFVINKYHQCKDWTQIKFPADSTELASECQPKAIPPLFHDSEWWEEPCGWSAYAAYCIDDWKERKWKKQKNNTRILK